MSKQSGGNTAQRVEALVRPTVEGMGLRLWDVGQKISGRLYRANENGVKEFSGLLTSREGNTITIEGPAGPMQFELSAVSTVRLCDDEDLFD